MTIKQIPLVSFTGWGGVLIVITVLEITFLTVQQGGNNKQKSLGGVKKDTIVS